MFCLCLYWQHGFYYVFVMHITGTAYNTLNTYPSMSVNEYNCSQKQNKLVIQNLFFSLLHYKYLKVGLKNRTKKTKLNIWKIQQYLFKRKYVLYKLISFCIKQ